MADLTPREDLGLELERVARHLWELRAGNGGPTTHRLWFRAVGGDRALQRRLARLHRDVQALAHELAPDAVPPPLEDGR